MSVRRTCAADGFEIYNPADLTDVAPDAMQANGRRLTEAVSKPILVSDYIAENYKYARSENAVFQKDTLIQAYKIYGNNMHQSRGNGDCGLISFATGLLYDALNNQNPETIQQIIDLMCQLDTRFSKELEENITEALGLLNEFQRNLNPQFLQEALLDNDSFMLSFSKVLRAIGHLNIQKVMRNEITDTGLPPDEYSEILIPKKNGEEISAEGYTALSRIFNVNIHLVDISGNIRQHGSMPVRQYHPSLIAAQRDADVQKKVADIVIIHAPNHFFTIVPDQERQRSHGLLASERKLAQRPSSLVNDHRRPTLQPASAPVINVKKQQTDCKASTLAISIIAILGSIFAIFQSIINYRNKSI